MFKLLRKYNRVLLAIFGVLLMITFLIPQAFNRFFRDAGTGRAVMATVDDGKKVSGVEWQQVQQELAFLQKVENYGMGVPGISPIQKPEEWYLLVREATAAGLVGTGDSVPISDQQLAQLEQMTQRDPDFIRQMIAKIDGVRQMLSLYQTGGLYSDRRLKLAAEKYLSSATADVVVLKAEPDKAALEPSEKEIADQMAKYADVLPGSGEMGFGYKLPDRLKLEWIKVTADSVRKAVEAGPEFSTKNQQMHWLRYAKDPGKNFPPVEKGAAVPEVVRKDLLDALTKAKTEAIALDIAGRLQLNRRGMIPENGYYVLPPDWQQRKLGFQQLISDVQAANPGLELPSYESTGDRWLSVTEVAKIPGISSATTDKLGNAPVSLGQLLQNIKEFNTSGGIIPIQQDIAGPPLKDPEGSLYVFRVIATDPSHKPRSIDEVRETVVADLKKAAQYQQLVDSSAQIEEQAETSGLLSLALEHDTNVQRASASLVNPSMIQYARQFGGLSVSPASLPEIGSDRATNEAILNYANSLPVGTAIDDLTEAQRVFVAPVKNKMSVMVVRLTGRTLLSREDFADLTQNRMIQSLLASEEGKETGKNKNLIAEAFGVDTLVKRHHFAFTRTNKAEDESGSTTPAQSPPTDSAAEVN